MTDEWETFFAGFAPIRGSNGDIIGIVSADLAANSFAARNKVIATLSGRSNTSKTRMVIRITISSIESISGNISHIDSTGKEDVPNPIKEVSQT